MILSLLQEDVLIIANNIIIVHVYLSTSASADFSLIFPFFFFALKFKSS